MWDPIIFCIRTFNFQCLVLYFRLLVLYLFMVYVYSTASTVLRPAISILNHSFTFYHTRRRNTETPAPRYRMISYLYCALYGIRYITLFTAKTHILHSSFLVAPSPSLGFFLSLSPTQHLSLPPRLKLNWLRTGGTIASNEPPVFFLPLRLSRTK